MTQALLSSRMVSLLFTCPLLLASILTEGGQCLKLVKVEVPRYRLRGDLAILGCHYELEAGDTLYAVKWYKENEEFYRYVPRSAPPKASYSVQGIKVDASMSNNNQVVLRNVNLKTSGVFRCEVSAEGPSFASDAAEAPMTVLFIPANGPHITGEKKQYLIGDEVNLNCTSGKSYPASLLHWYVNDQLVGEGEGLIHYPEQIHHPHGLLTTTLGLRLRVEPHHFRNEAMRLRCLASLSPVLWTGDQESVLEPKLLPESSRNREALLLVRGSGASLRGSVWPVLLLLTICLSSADIFNTT